MDKITLLDTDLLQNEKLFREVIYWKNFFRAQLGWHYVLDLIWKLEKIDLLELPKGSRIIDAGAGYGLMQYILAGRGFNVISIDFAPRKITWPKSWIFQMKMMNDEKFDDEYISFLKDKSTLCEALKKPHKGFFKCGGLYGYERVEKIKTDGLKLFHGGPLLGIEKR